MRKRLQLPFRAGAAWLLVASSALSSACATAMAASRTGAPDPAFLSVAGPEGRKSFGLILPGTRTLLEVTARDAAGRPAALAARPVFTSRAPGIVAVDDSGAVTAVSPGSAYVVGRIAVAQQVLADSVEVRVLCTAELHVEITPSDTTIRAGETFTSAASLSTCGRHVPVADVFTWRARDARILAVDSATGAVRGRSPGVTWVDLTARRHGALGAVRVSVVAGGAPARSRTSPK